VGTFAKLLRNRDVEVVCVEADAYLSDVLTRDGFQTFTDLNKVLEDSFQFMFALNVRRRSKFPSLHCRPRAAASATMLGGYRLEPIEQEGQPLTSAHSRGYEDGDERTDGERCENDSPHEKGYHIATARQQGLNASPAWRLFVLPSSPLSELARVLVRLDHIASIIVNANHTIM
jgi:hypothetical protein